MSRLRAFLILSLIWALIFLPALGTTEYKGEEPRRVLPAVAMLETGNWIVPQLCGEPFLRKPPLVNWLIAASFKITGIQNEWTARLPSVLAVWLLGVGILFFCGSWLGVETALVAAIIAIAHFGMIDKGRMAEIEAEYIALSGLAAVAWLALHVQKKSVWLQWLIPALFLGISFLAKGPVNLVFFYPMVLAVLVAERDWRTLFSPAHFLGMLIMGGIFAAWLVPYAHLAPPNAAEVAAHQSAGRFTSDFNLMNWLTCIPRGLINFLPWVLLAPLCWRRDVVEREGAWFVAARRALVATFVILLLLPGMLPRYSQPLLIPMSILIAIALRDAPAALLEKWRKFIPWSQGSTPAALIIASTAILCAGMFLYAIAAVTVIRQHDDLRPLGKKIDRAIPPGESLYLVDCGYKPFFAYITSPSIYLEHFDELPADAQNVLISSREWKKVSKKQPTLKVKTSVPIEGKATLYLVEKS